MIGRLILRGEEQEQVEVICEPRTVDRLAQPRVKSGEVVTGTNKDKALLA